MKIIEQRKERLERFLKFIIKNKEECSFTKIRALFGLMTGLHPVTVGAYSKALIEGGAIKVKEDKVVEAVNHLPNA